MSHEYLVRAGTVSYLISAPNGREAKRALLRQLARVGLPFTLRMEDLTARRANQTELDEFAKVAREGKQQYRYRNEMSRVDR